MHVFSMVNKLTGMKTVRAVTKNSTAMVEIVEVAGSFIVTVRSRHRLPFSADENTTTTTFLSAELKWLLHMLDRGTPLPANEPDIELVDQGNSLAALTRDKRVMLTIAEEQNGSITVTAGPAEQVSIALNGEKLHGQACSVKPVSPEGRRIIDWLNHAGKVAPRLPSLAPMVTMADAANHHYPFDGW